MQTFTYTFDEMPPAVLNLALSLGPDFNLDLFDGGLLIRELGSCDGALVAMIRPEVEAAHALLDPSDADIHMIEAALAANFSRALTAASLTGDDWTADDEVSDELAALHPDLEFVCLDRGVVAA